ncbi:retinal guanylyl cyclase 2-like [Tubulanus polymorphus]|uniref:retinal guanylyl cyclase 2-like n=1 Tax=Tubulanus polymorphus TaxID=672921 RepID=UPI003DA5D505
MSFVFSFKRSDAINMSYEERIVLPETRPVVSIAGSGASFPAEVYSSWIEQYKLYRSKHIDLLMSYTVKGSSAGVRDIRASKVDFAGSDNGLDDRNLAEKSEILEIPAMAGAIVLGYNLPGIPKGQKLRLNRDQIVGIFNGTILNWNHASLQRTNPNFTLPDEKILVVVRADKSGTTSTFTRALGSFSQAWKRTKGSFSQGLNETTWEPIHWEKRVIYQYGHRTRGVSGILMSIRYTIGYLSPSDAKEAGISTAAIGNKAGNFIESGPTEVQNAMDDFMDDFDSNLNVYIVDPPGAHSYPISSYTYFLIHKKGYDACEIITELVRFIEWFLVDDVAKDVCIAHNMTAMSPRIAERIIQKILKNISCRGENVYRLMLTQKEEEDYVAETWVIPVAVFIPLTFVVIFSLVGYIVFQRYKVWKMINSNEWDIPIEEVLFYYSPTVRKMGSRSGKSLKSFSSIGDSESFQEMVECSTEKIREVLQWPGKWKSYTIGFRLIELSDLEPMQTATKRLLLNMRDSINHMNVLRFYGLAKIENDHYVVSDYCSKGQILEILRDEKFNLNLDIKFSLTSDIVMGMAFLHGHNIVHGNLKSACCLVDSHWTVRVADWEYVQIYSTIKSKRKRSPLLAIRASADDIGKHEAAFREFWTAPEAIRAGYDIVPLSSLDVYSFGIILYEIFSRNDPYIEHADTMNADDVLKAIVNNNLRPEPDDDTPIQVKQLMEIAWADDPATRPSFDQMAKMIKHANPTKKNMLDSMMEEMELYTSLLEDKVEEKTTEIEASKMSIQRMFCNSLPRDIVKRITDGFAVDPQEHRSVAVMALELNNLTSVMNDPSKCHETLTVLSNLFQTLNDIVKKKPDIYQLQMFGDTVVCMSGLTKRIGKKHVNRIACLILELVDACLNYKLPTGDSPLSSAPVSFRCGFHCGAVVTGMLGETCTGNFCVFGDTVNTALTLMYTSQTNCIQVSETVHRILCNIGRYMFEPRGEVFLKGKNSVMTYWLKGKDDRQLDTSTTERLNGLKRLNGLVEVVPPTLV